ncbi:MAG TPA: N-acetylmuramoyl-L-alanine amidase [Terriglobales bacterium]|nr:N-acetylmuramoyl-L-alanine amidase [Terriglobales bacterium]
MTISSRGTSSTTLADEEKTGSGSLQTGTGTPAGYQTTTPPPPQTTTPPPTAPPTGPAGSPASEQPPRRPPQAPAFSVVIDPAHGGHDPGARIAPNLLEKDLTLALARKLRQELQARHIAAALLRDNDADMSFEQRAAATNLARPSVFISVHAEPGSIVRIYTAALNLASDTKSDRSGFLLWDTAQNAFRGESAAFASSTSNSIVKRELAAPVQPAFVQPLHSIAAPAIAIEVPATKKGFKISADLIAGALADAVATRKMNLGGTR